MAHTPVAALVLTLAAAAPFTGGCGIPAPALGPVTHALWFTGDAERGDTLLAALDGRAYLHARHVVVEIEHGQLGLQGAVGTIRAATAVPAGRSWRLLEVGAERRPDQYLHGGGDLMWTPLRLMLATTRADSIGRGVHLVVVIERADRRYRTVLPERLVVPLALRDRGSLFPEQQ